jgi:hypothetical protein
MTGHPGGMSLPVAVRKDRAMGGQTNFEFVCPGRMTIVRFCVWPCQWQMAIDNQGCSVSVVR